MNISTSALRTFVDQVFAAKYPDLCPDAETTVDPQVIQSNPREVDMFRQALADRSEPTAADLKSAFEGEARRTGYLELGLAAVGILAAGVAFGIILGPAAPLGAAEAVSFLGVAGAAGLGARKASIVRADKERYATQVVQFGRVYEDYQNGVGGQTCYMIDRGALRGGETHGIIAIPARTLRPA